MCSHFGAVIRWIFPVRVGCRKGSELPGPCLNMPLACIIGLKRLRKPNLNPAGAINSAARVLPSHGRSHWFESSIAHMTRQPRRSRGVFTLNSSLIPILRRYWTRTGGATATDQGAAADRDVGGAPQAARRAAGGCRRTPGESSIAHMTRQPRRSREFSG